jgi:hypothetical protein
MPSNSETLTLVAQVVDKYSKEIRDFQRSMRMGEHGKAVNVEGARYAKVHKDAFEALRKTARETSDHFKNVFNPAMVGLGLSAITVGDAISNLTKGVKDLGEFGREIGYLSKETGLSVNQLNTLREAGIRARLGVGQVSNSLRDANREIAQFKQGRDTGLMTFFDRNMHVPVIAQLRKDVMASQLDFAEFMPRSKALP